MGFRGNKEHAELMFHQISSGHFPENHALYPGKEWWGLNAFVQDKTHQLSTTNPYSRENGEAFSRFPVLPERPDINIGGAIKLYCSHFPKNVEGRFYRKVRRNGTGFTQSQYVGKDTVTKMIREGFRILGIERYMELRPHALRGHFVSILANDPHINDSEKLAACRHRSLKTNQKYQQRGNAQESRRLQALLSHKSPVAPPVAAVAQPVAEVPTVAAVVSTPTVAAVATVPEKTVSFSPQLELQQPSPSGNSYVPFTQSPAPCTTTTYAATSTYATSTSSTAPTPEYVSSIPSVSSSTSAYSRPTATANDTYSEFTQQQVDGLYNDLADLEKARANQHQRIVRMKRNMSEREQEIRLLRHEVHQLRRESQLAFFPYRSHDEEYNSLINESLYNDAENRLDNVRRRSWEATERWERMKNLNGKRQRKSW